MVVAFTLLVVLALVVVVFAALVVVGLGLVFGTLAVVVHFVLVTKPVVVLAVVGALENVVGLRLEIVVAQRVVVLNPDEEVVRAGEEVDLEDVVGDAVELVFDVGARGLVVLALLVVGTADEVVERTDVVGAAEEVLAHGVVVDLVLVVVALMDDVVVAAELDEVITAFDELVGAAGEEGLELGFCSDEVLGVVAAVLIFEDVVVQSMIRSAGDSGLLAEVARTLPNGGSGGCCALGGSGIR